MAEDPERKLHNIMDKLYGSTKPKSIPSLSSDRGGGGVAIKKWQTVQQPPKCRPWERGDLMRRLATFKAMTWFGKPKAVSPVNCARRGWVNVEMDTIACEACGARILFSTPPSWSLQQVENAAAVFSLKLDSGHKRPCPWINNVCDEALAFFPPTPFPALIEGYKQRCSTLIRFSALPIISSAAIDYMKSPQLDHVLSMASHSSVTLTSGFKLVDACGSKLSECESDVAAASLYYQAQKIISLCGWEPRVLPYAVDFEEDHAAPSKDTRPNDFSAEACEKQKGRLAVYSLDSGKENEGRNDASSALDEFNYESSSVVLDCNLCGASVGLWAFKTIERPLEVFSFIESADCSNRVEPSTSADHGVKNQNAEADVDKGVSSTVATKERPFGLNLTIAGGPPATKQHFRPRVSFPIVSRHLRPQLCSEDVAVSLKRKRNENELGICGNSDVTDQHLQEASNHAQEGTNSEMTADNSNVKPLPESNVILQSPIRTPDGPEEPANPVKTGKHSVTNADAIIVDGEGCQNNSASGNLGDQTNAISKDFQNKASDTNNGSSNVAALIIGETHGRKDSGLSFVNQNTAAQHQSGLKDHFYEKINGLDPIRQHRPFCPWIAFVDGENTPGWKMTVSALYNPDKESSSPLLSEAESTFLDEIDDPLTSVRKLFTSPIKRAKLTQ